MRGSKKVYIGRPSVGLLRRKRKTAKDTVVLQPNTPDLTGRCQIFPVSLPHVMVLG